MRPAQRPAIVLYLECGEGCLCSWYTSCITYYVLHVDPHRNKMLGTIYNTITMMSASIQVNEASHKKDYLNLNIIPLLHYMMHPN